MCLEDEERGIRSSQQSSMLSQVTCKFVHEPNAKEMFFFLPKYSLIRGIFLAKLPAKASITSSMLARSAGCTQCLGV